MPGLSTLLLACALHLGTAPPASRWSVPAVLAPVAEPDVDLRVREALLDALAARGALGGPPLSVTVTVATFLPSRRAADTLLYDATLVLRVRAGARERDVLATASVIDPGNAGDASVLRADAFRRLARTAAAEVAAWAVAPP
jgi:hypothetical protein